MHTFHCAQTRVVFISYLQQSFKKFSHQYINDFFSLFQEPLFVARFFYDLLFFFIVIIIILNLIFGVIIDTFADLRSEKQQKDEILRNTCFVCGKCTEMWKKNNT